MVDLDKLLKEINIDVASSRIIPKDLVFTITTILDNMKMPGIHTILDTHQAMIDHMDLVTMLSWLQSRWKYKRDEQFYDIYRASSDDIRDRGGRITENEIISNVWSVHSFSKAEILSNIFDSISTALVIRGRFIEQISNNIRLGEKIDS